MKQMQLFRRIIVLILVTLILQSLTACGKGSSEATEPATTLPSEQTESSELNNAPSESEENTVALIPEIDYENLVTDAYQDAFTDDDDFEYCYHIPQFNLQDDLAQEINKTIYDQYSAILERDVYDCMDEYDYPAIENMLYYWGYHGQYASVVIETSTSMYADFQYSVFTISAADGHVVSTDELLSAYGMDQNAFDALVYDRLTQYWEEMDEMRDDVGRDFFDDRVTKTLADSNIRNAIPFINPNGELAFVANIYSLADGDCYWHLINANGTLEMEYPECSADHSADIAKPTGDALQYFIENCDIIYFEKSDIESFDADMCRLARNGIFARSGRKFRSQDLQEYFNQFNWYEPNIEPDQFDDDMLNRKQLANLELIQAKEQELSRTISISEDEAYQIACKYWDYTPGDVAGESGYELYVVSDGLTEASDGNQYYSFRLRWMVQDFDGGGHLSTLDQVYVHPETGECFYPW